MSGGGHGDGLGNRGDRSWLALAVRAQGYISQARQQDLQAAREDEALARAATVQAEGEVTSVVAAWRRHRADCGGAGPLESGYGLFHAFVEAERRQARVKERDSVAATNVALGALRDSFNRQQALEVVEQRALVEQRVERQRLEERAIAESWMLRRASESKEPA